MPKHAAPDRSRRRRARTGRRRSRRLLLGVGGPLVVLVLLVGAWAVDAFALGGDVARNTTVAGTDVGGDTTGELHRELADYAGRLAGTEVRISTGDATYTTTAADLGVGIDEAATARRALDAGQDGFAGLRPFVWAWSFVSAHDLDPVVTIDRSVFDDAVVELQGDDRTAPVEPTLVQADDGSIQLQPGVPGAGLDLDAVAEGVRAAVADGGNPLVVRVAPGAIAPETDDATMQALADEANTITDAPLVVRAGGQSVEVDTVTERSWLRVVPPGDGTGPSLAVDQDAAVSSLRDLLPGIDTEPVSARFDLQDGTPVVIPGSDGSGCCGPDTAATILAALQGGAGLVDLELTVTHPELTTEQAQAYGITQQVGGTRAWPESRTDEVGPGFTTFHAAGEARVTNIHRIADLVRGAVIPPGGTFSVNDYVGERTTANGFVAAGAIRNGEHVSEVGGGVSQFATTLFNAAYFAGLDIGEYQSHSEYFSRYPRGREATMGFPHPDLQIENTTPYGVLIWTSYTAGSLTITLYSTPFAQGEQTGIREARSGNCTVVTTTRTRTYVDGRPPVEDTFRATYRPGPGQFC
jgi:vancomycin resistance protein YoaR